MVQRSVHPIPFHRIAIRLALLLTLAFGGLAGCDAISGLTGDDDSIEGVWMVDEGTFVVFLEITSSTITVYDGDPSECFYIEVFNITNVDGDQYTITQAGTSFSITLTIRRDGDNLSISFTDNGTTETEIYQPSDQDVSQLQECTVAAGGGDDPAISCSALPAISVGQTINGDLSSSDDTFEGAYFDLYGLTLGSSTTVQIDAASSEFDTYLYLYQGDGTYIANNDDGGTGTDSSLSITLDAGCYRIEITSFFSGETGSYTLSVN